MTISQLQYVVALDTHRHFVKAAESCHVAQPTLTLQVKKLEEQIGLVIFDRSSQPIVPTPMGKQFIEQSRTILTEVGRLKSLVNKDKQDMSGTYRIGIIPSLSPYLLPLFIPAFSQKNPDTTLVIKEWQSDAIIEGLKTDQLDLGLLVTPLEEENIREIPLFHEPFLVYAHATHPILQIQQLTTKHIRSAELWLLEKGHCFRNQSLNLCTPDKEPEARRNIRFEGGSLETLKLMVQRLSGYTLIPELAYDSIKDKGLVNRFAEPQPAREVSIVSHKIFTKEKLLAAIRESILENIPNDYKSNAKFKTIKWR